MKKDTQVIVVETTPHRQTSTVWTACPTVGAVIDYMQVKTAFSNTQPYAFLLKNAGKTFEDFTDEDEAEAWQVRQTVEDWFEASIDCVRDDGHIVNAYWSKAEAEEAGAPRYMSDEAYAAALERY